MKNTKQNTNKKSLLIDNLYDFIQNNSLDKLELKPQLFLINDKEENFSLISKDEDLELYKKDYSSRIDKQIMIISLNISNSLFALNNLKFTAFMSRYNVWGFDLTMLQFIINFYLVVKTDNLLRQFVMNHLDKIINVTKNIILKYLITHMNDFTFKETRTDYNKKKVMDKLKKNQKLIDDKLKNKDLLVEKKEKLKDSLKENLLSNNKIKIKPFEEQLKNNKGAPKIFSLDLIMNMSEEELDHMNELQKEEEEKLLLPKVRIKEKENSELLEENLQNEELAQMEQLILANLRREHPDLQKGFENNG